MYEAQQHSTNEGGCTNQADLCSFARGYAAGMLAAINVAGTGVRCNCAFDTDLKASGVGKSVLGVITHTHPHSKRPNRRCCSQPP